MPIRRQLVYIEPSPEQVDNKEENQQKPNRKPNAVENISVAINLPRYETIRKDIERIIQRNQLIERILTVTNESELEDEILDNHLQNQSFNELYFTLQSNVISDQ